MSKVIKKNGKFILEPDAKNLARAERAADKERLNQKLSDEQLRAILQRILDRLAALEG
ncbi:MAG: hypothetical protein KBF64_07135 [Anaerolineaceae bacterium]|nr:hypothetical protein [Anaerolineaceae bacterium]